MKKTQLIYWLATGLLSLMMLFSAFAYLTNPEMATGFRHLGFPDYFRVELAVAKAVGALALLVPAVPVRVKEWAYAGFGLTFLSASVAHTMSGDPLAARLAPLVFLLVLGISYVYFLKLRRPLALAA